MFAVLHRALVAITAALAAVAGVSAGPARAPAPAQGPAPAPAQGPAPGPAPAPAPAQGRAPGPPARPPATAGTEGPSPYAPPVDTAVSRGFDAGLGRYAAGNRGLDYLIAPATPVRAIGSGVVVFAGPVAGAWWVTVLHPDGLRSSLGPMTTVTVVAGQAVGRGAEVGTAGPVLHLGVRRGDVYLDPASLFGPHGPARLVPVPLPTDYTFAPARPGRSPTWNGPHVLHV